MVNLASLFEPIGSQIWNKKLKWQPVPVHTQPQTDDNLLAGEKKCDHFDYIMLKHMNGSEYKGFFEQSASFIRCVEGLLKSYQFITNRLKFVRYFQFIQLCGKKFWDESSNNHRYEQSL